MITPGEINTKRFEKASFGGYKTEDVDNYLTLLAGEFAKVLDENTELESKILVLVDKLEEYKADEDSLKSAIVEAQKLSSNVIRDAKTKAEIIIRDANKKVEEIIEDAKFRIDKEKLTLSKMQKEVATFKAQILSLYKKHIEILDDIPENRDVEYNFDAALNSIAGNEVDEEIPAVVEVEDVSETFEETNETYKAVTLEEPAQETEVSIDGFAISTEDEDEVLEIIEEEDEYEEPPMPKKTSRFGELKFGDEYSIKQEQDHSRFGRRKK